MDSKDQSSGLDYALLHVTPVGHIPDNSIKVGINDPSVVEVQRVVSPESLDVETLAATSRGIIKGYMSGTPSYSGVPGHGSFDKMFKVDLDGPLQRGDSGTWVIDAKCGDLYGHIIAGSPGDGVALIAPFTDIFEDVHDRLGESPHLPTAWDGAVGETTNDGSVEIEARLQDGASMSQSERLLNSVANNNIAAISTGNNNKTMSVAHESGGENQLPHTADAGPGPQQERNSDTAQSEIVIREREPSTQEGLALSEWWTQWSEGGETYDSHETMESKEKDKSTNTQSVPPTPSDNSPQIPTLVPTAPSSEDKTALEFRDLLWALAETPIDLRSTPPLLNNNLRTIYSEAEKKCNDLIAKADNMHKPEWGYQDCVIQALLQHFRHRFCLGDDEPCKSCNRTHPPFRTTGSKPPTPEESVTGATVAEIYRCVDENCSAYIRSLRYENGMVVSRVRRASVEDWAKSFTRLCHTLGSRARWVWSADSETWTEVYSEHQNRWVHVDVREGVWDRPQLYTEGWGMKMSYCIAFSADGATDVTCRYVRSPDCALPRTKCPEEVLLYIVQEIRKQRRMDMSEEEKSRLEREDATEARELQSYVVEPLTSGVSRLPTRRGPSSGGSSSTAFEQRGFPKSDDVSRGSAKGGSTSDAAGTGDLAHPPCNPPSCHSYTSVAPTAMPGRGSLPSINWR
ncbi:hypothetical protein VMCG_07259 [Cytospora schulzeri]|uniref:Transglutaminase-like domain-containing protein n=1 Tax=Cytospora schulzeri TaxID=448051 RepID=A0A423WAB1_9PEZI|nr:hypothetical protein VMCG_07259 [Valsa malicola]